MIDNGLLSMMLGVSLFLGIVALGAFLWGLKSGQFDDAEKFAHGALFDSEEDLNDAAEREKKRKEREG